MIPWPMGHLLLLFHTFIIFGTSTAVSVLNLLQYISHTDSILLVFIISGFLVSLISLTSFISRYFAQSALVIFINLVITTLVYLFYISIGIAFECKVDHSYNSPHKKVVFILYIVNIFFMGIDARSLMYSIQDFPSPADLENIQNESTNTLHTSNNLKSCQTEKIPNKESIQTLVSDSEAQTQNFYSQYEEILSAPNYQHNTDFTQNWMNNTYKITPQSSPPLSKVSRKKSIKSIAAKFPHSHKKVFETPVFNIPRRSYDNSSYNANSHSRHKSLNAESYRYATDSKDKKISVSTIAQSVQDDLRERPVSMIHNGCTSTSNTQILQNMENLSSSSLLSISEDSRRSKSLGCIVYSKENKQERKRLKWKSIHDEKLFMKGVSNSLLPPVLKSGESHILQLKRDMNCGEEEGSRRRVSFEDDGNGDYEVCDNFKFSGFKVPDLPNKKDSHSHSHSHSQSNSKSISNSQFMENNELNSKLHESSEIGRVNYRDSADDNSSHINNNPPSRFPSIEVGLYDDNISTIMEKLVIYNTTTGDHVAVDNIDTLSDFNSSAPSLHTFRDISPSSSVLAAQKLEKDIQEQYENEFEENLEKKLEKEAEQNGFKTPVSVSPTKKIRDFIQGSPNKITTRLKKISKSLDLDMNNRHNHNRTNSIFSIYSNTSKANSNYKMFSKPDHEANEEPLRKEIEQSPRSFESDVSVQSECPSGAIGQYDKEKWGIIKTLKDLA